MLALATSLPEIPTGLQSIRQGDDVYAVGLLFRPARRVLGMGIDSLAVLVLYLVGVGGLVSVAG